MTEFQFYLQIPYFDSESLQCLKANGCGNEVCKTSRSDELVLKNIYNADLGSAKNWHEASTLDQSYYVSLEDRDSSLRNIDQVVFKNRQEIQKDNILMVKQMWIWKMDYG